MIDICFAEHVSKPAESPLGITQEMMCELVTKGPVVWRVGQRCFFLTWAHWSSIPLLQLAEGDSGVAHPSVLRVRVFLRCAFSEGYAQSSEASLRARRPSFRYLQLLSAETAAGDGSREESLGEDSGGSAATACVPLNRICGDAGTRTSAAQRTSQEGPVEDFAGVETESRAGAIEAKTSDRRTVVVAVRGECERGSAFLAAAILRFQCVEREEAAREIAVHACESGAEKAGATSEGLALEQLGALRGEGREQNSDRFRLRKEGGSNDIEEESKPAPLTPKGAAPPKSKTTAKASLPACHPPR